MAAVGGLTLPLFDVTGRETGALCIALLPADLENGVSPLVAPVQLLEGAEYRYVWKLVSDATIEVQPAEVFQADTKDGRSGRIRPGLYTGAMRVSLRQNGTEVGGLELEIRSRKLNYLDEYRWMLKDIADQMTELVMDRFAVSSSRFEIDETRDAVTLYQRFAFLKALFSGESFQAAISEIVRRPHVAWEDSREVIRPGQAIKSNAHLVRQLTRSGARSAWSDGPLASVPNRLERVRTDATHDTTPNRFVRFALERWRQVVSDIERSLQRETSNNPALKRGVREVAQMLMHIDEVLHNELFRELGPLTRFPADNQVLQKREGYRDVLRAYLEFELAAKLSWQGGQSVYGAGQRDVATLYEYWVFLQLAQTVAQLIGVSFDLAKLIVPRGDGLNLVLQTGRETALSGHVVRHGRKLKVELCFNRTFKGGAGKEQQGSWTKSMRPDYSLIIRPGEGESALFEPIMVHFDAKYRVQFVSELFGGDETEFPVHGDAGIWKRGGPLRADLLKMHAYRDAIRRSAGAYVLYPGADEGKVDQEYHELLPGLGAFVLRPSAQGNAVGVPALRRFVSDVLDHVATQLTAHERSRDDLAKIYETSVNRGGDKDTLWSQPPGGTSVLLGWVKNKDHWAWIQQHLSYNVRASGRRGGQRVDEPLLYCQMLLLYGPDGVPPTLARIISDPMVVKESGMLGNGYPSPQGDYLCVEIRWMNHPSWLHGIDVEGLMSLATSNGAIRGEPVQVNWEQIMKAAVRS
jgi:predicted component of viral defense system (DUF524 family)